MKSTIFLSYTSSLGDTAARIQLSLQGEGYSVFRDRTELPPGESFDARIRTAIEESDLFVFLVSPESVAPGRYTLTELKFAEQKWPHPAGRVLPVFAEPTPKESIPAYLRAVTILQPRGDIVAEVAAEAARMCRPWWRRMLEPRRLVPAAVAALLMAGVAWVVLPPYFERSERNAKAQALIVQSRTQAGAGDYDKAWELLEQAHAVAPASGEVVAAQEDLAMTLVRGTGVSHLGAGSGGVDEVVKATLPVLSRGAASASGERLANLQAHLGWIDYLRGGRSGAGEPDPARQYRRALEADPGNVYAHAMWGFELLRRRSADALAAARPHFAAAVQAGKERDYVRHLHVSALLQTYGTVWIEDPERQKDVLRVVNEMRVHGETRPKGWGRGSFNAKVWAIYHFGFVTSDEQAPLLAALPPQEHLATFRWLFPESELDLGRTGPTLFNYLTVLAQLEELGGERAAALSSYRRLAGEFTSKGYDTSRAVQLAERARAAIRRLGG